MHCSIENIENKPRMGLTADAPAHNTAGIGVDDKGETDEASPGADIGNATPP